MNTAWGTFGFTPTATPSMLPKPYPTSPVGSGPTPTFTPSVAQELLPPPIDNRLTDPGFSPGYPMPMLPAPPGSPAATGTGYTAETFGPHWSETLAAQGVLPPAPLDAFNRRAYMTPQQDTGGFPWLRAIGAVLVVGGIGTGIWWLATRRNRRTPDLLPRRRR